ncbi:efflux RND transporter periplasmic adaptor subunit [Tahibacter amnicola]|uniref:Efflux RND transporter periplasmic adaptor subunit n=1 Tax=Tahibacter amnicola TaxID=2976241 RepID=A0ABY6BHS5_9GAMM|nr:efflux RND transporter periplasmic adaptor subunit [Tahibacter amnicola]UXI68893.1 efflux RND transporter periplasmic adaptor subunit [Tahibacter amnicola]
MTRSIGSRFLLVLTLGSAVLAGCGRSGGAAAPPPSPPVSVTARVVEPAPWTDEIQALGTARANESITLTAKIAETVRKVNFTDGQKVAAGDVLVELTSHQQAAQLKDAQATAKDAQRQYQRQQDLVTQGTVSKALFDTAQAARDSNQAKVEAIRAQLADRVITAPFGGVLGLRQVSPGTLVTPGTPITTLDDIDRIKLDFSVPETFIAALSANQDVTATSVAWPGREFHGRVLSVDSRVDPVTRSIIVRAEIDNTDHALRPGMLLSVRLLRPERQALALPEIALVQVGTDAYVYRIRGDSTVEQVKIGLGVRRRGEVEVISGLQPGDRVVVEGTVKLRGGAKVAIVEPPATPATAAN